MQVVLFDKAGERILARSMDAARRLLPAGPGDRRLQEQQRRQGQLVRLPRELPRRPRVPFAMLVRNLIPWFVTRQVFTGAGKVGSENGADAVDFQISQRADFFEEEVGLETTLKRPIVNTRDEPHADPQKYRRLHVIVGDANLCEVATFLKVGTTAIVLAMIEDGFIDKDLSIIGAGARDAHGVARPDVPRDGRRRVDSVAAPRSSCSGSSCGSRASTPTRPASRRAAATRSARMVLDRWEAGAHRARARPVGARRPARLGHQARTCCARTSTATSSSWNDPKLVAARPPVPRRAPGPVALRAARAGGQGRAPGRRGRRARARWPIRPRRPGPISGARASPAGPTPWSPPTGTAWCSTSAPTRCEGSR